MRLAALLTTIALLLTACAGADDAGTPAPAGTPPAADGAAGSTTQPTIAGSWVLTAGAVDGEPLTPVDGNPVSLEIEAGEVSGTAGCNTYSSQITGEPPAVSIGEVVRTEIACEPAEVMQVETAYLDALSRVDAATAGPDGLTLSGDGVSLAFAPA